MQLFQKIIPPVGLLCFPYMAYALGQLSANLFFSSQLQLAFIHIGHILTLLFWDIDKVKYLV